MLSIAVSLLLPALGIAEKPVFTRDVMAVLSRAGCNAGACHGNLNGKGGLKLSLRGEDAALDYSTLTRDLFGRRIDQHVPDNSLLLQKASGQLPHEGGVRFSPTSHEYRILKDWIANGSQYQEAAHVTNLQVTPSGQVLFEPNDRVQLRVKATFSDGRQRDVTHLASMETSNVGVAQIRSTGEVVREQTGDVVIIVRFLNQQVPVRLAFLPTRSKVELSAWMKHHPLDVAFAKQWEQFRLQPSAMSTDEVFIRRAYLDACGIIPSAQEVRAFIADRTVEKRSQLIDKLLSSPEFAQFWTQKWADLLRLEEKSLDRKGVNVFHRWIKEWIQADRPWNEFAAEVVTGLGNTYSHPPANFYRAIRDPYARAEAVAQVFLGLRISCARCHNHPFDVWTQDDYHRFAAVFSRVDYRVTENNRRDRLDKHEFIGEQIVLQNSQGELTHPRGGVAKPKILSDSNGEAALSANRLDALGSWLAEADNPFFARAQANRVWLHLTGRGLVEPNDDFRATNPATNPEVLDLLTQEFRRSGFRLKPLVRYIMLSKTYQLSSSPSSNNGSDESFFSRALVQPLEAEQLLDALAKVFDVPVQMPGYPTGIRAGEVPATPLAGRRSADSPGTRFLKVFGKPDRLLTCECERSEDPGMLQAFQLITGEMLNSMLRSPDNRLSRLLQAKRSDAAILEELTLTALARYPTANERERLLAYVQKSNHARSAWEDIAWGLVNSKEFLLRR